METGITACSDRRTMSEKRVHAGTYSLFGFGCSYAMILERIPSKSLHDTEDPTVSFALASWTSLTHQDEPIDGIRHNQRACDTPVARSAYEDLQTSCDTPAEKARLKAAEATHAGDWLNALPLTAIGLRLSDEAIRVAVEFRLGCITCQPHVCIRGAMVDARGLHGLSCRNSGARHIRHSPLNDLNWRAVKREKIPATNEPIGLSRSYGKKPDGASLIPWKRRKPLAWDITVPDTYVASHIGKTAENVEPQPTSQQPTKLLNTSALPQHITSSRSRQIRRSLEPRRIGIYRGTRQENHRGYTRTFGNAISLPTVVHSTAERKRYSFQKHV